MKNLGTKRKPIWIARIPRVQPKYFGCHLFNTLISDHWVLYNTMGIVLVVAYVTQCYIACLFMVKFSPSQLPVCLFVCLSNSYGLNSWSSLFNHLHSLCDNQITEMSLLVKEARFETQQANTRRCIQTQNYITKDLRSKSEMEKSSSTFVKVLVPRICYFCVFESE